MSAGVCERCDADTPGGNLCPGCTVKATATLAQARRLLPDLLVSMSRQGRQAPRTGGRSAESPMPVDLVAGAAYALLWGALERQGLTPVLRGPGWLTEATLALRDRLGASQAWASIELAVARAVKVIDRPPDQSYLGTCSIVGTDGVACRQDLYAPSDTTDYACPRCSAPHHVNTRRQIMLRAVEDVWATGPDLARAVTWLADGQATVSPELIRKWAHRGKLEAVGASSGGHPLYRVGDALALVRERIGAN